MGRRAVGTAVVARGQIWWADIGLSEKKRFVIVSNNVRNSKLQDVLGARITTANKPPIPSIVEFAPGEIDQPRCFVVADDIVPLLKEQLNQSVGALTPHQMQRVDDALRAALDL
jgi:mRNA-degrading endonuclease toxin of MazEF toxin-antitoxin module